MPHRERNLDAVLAENERLRQRVEALEAALLTRAAPPSSSLAPMESAVRPSSAALVPLSVEGLRHSDSVLQRVFDILPIGLWFAGPDGRLLRGNPEGRRIWGAEPLVPPEDYGVFHARRLPEGSELGPEDWALVRTVRDQETILDELLEIDAFDGQTRTILNSTAPVLDDAGRLLGAVVLNQDITQRTRAAKALRQSEERFRSYTQHAPYGIFVADGAGRYINVNAAACRITGWSEAELLTLSISDLLGPDCLAEGVAHFEHLKQEGQDYGEFSYLHRSGELRRWTVSAVRLEQDRYLGFVEDVTERRREERERELLREQLVQAQKMESVGRLAGGVAHDFNNMLGVILGHTEMALSEVDPGQTIASDLEQIQLAAQRSADLTRQLLAFARKQAVAPVVLDLNLAAAGTLQLLQRLIGEDIALVWSPGPDLWPVRIDPAQVDQILTNLCVNARDAIGGPGRIHLETRNVSLDGPYCSSHGSRVVPGDYVLLAVSDDGAGMDGPTLARLFEPFFTTKDLGRGTGLGLATVYGAVQQNGGVIDVYSELGQGSTFKIYLPRYSGARSGSQAQPLETAEVAHCGTALIVEDEPGILAVVQRMLQRLGYEVLIATGPLEALGLVERYRGSLDLLVTDVIMPDMHGRELAERVRQARPGLPCLYMSGYTADVMEERGALDAGAAFVSKPFGFQELAAAVARALER